MMMRAILVICLVINAASTFVAAASADAVVSEFEDFMESTNPPSQTIEKTGDNSQQVQAPPQSDDNQDVPNAYEKDSVSAHIQSLGLHPMGASDLKKKDDKQAEALKNRPMSADEVQAAVDLWNSAASEDMKVTSDDMPANQN